MGEFVTDKETILEILKKRGIAVNNLGRNVEIDEDITLVFTRDGELEKISNERSESYDGDYDY